MPRVIGKALVSEATEKVLGRTLVVASMEILTKLYDVPGNVLKALWVEFNMVITRSHPHEKSLPTGWGEPNSSFEGGCREVTIL